MPKPKPATSYNLLPPGVRITCQVTRGSGSIPPHVYPNWGVYPDTGRTVGEA